MSLNLPQEYINLLRERRALLWLCQRHELLPGKKIHDDEASLLDVERSYRSEVSELDLKIASIYWEAIWSDSVKGLIVKATEQKIKDSKTPNNARLPLILATDPDQEGQIYTREHLPIYLLRGLLNYSDIEGRFPSQALLRRLRYQLNTLRKLQDYPDRLLVILGGQEDTDLELSFDAIAEFAPPDMKVVIVWPSDSLKIPDNIRIPVMVWNGSSEQFIDFLISLEVPEADHISKFQIRIRNKSLALTDIEISKILDSYNVILENDLIKTDPKDVNRNVFEQFIRGDEKDWRGYATGLVYPRDYQPLNISLSLDKLLIRELEKTATMSETSNVTLTLPAQTGSGVTTLLRQAAFKVASLGFPTLLLQQSQVGLNIDILSSFLSRIQQKSITELSIPNIPALIIFDSVHEYIKDTYEVAQSLSTRGRPVVVLRVENIQKIGANMTDDVDRINMRVRGRHLRLQPLYSEVDGADIANISSHFTEIARKYPLGLEIPSYDEWISYQTNQTFTSPEGELEPDSLFWVALHFFLFNRVEQSPQEFGNWIWRIYERLAPSKLRDVILRIAVLSSYRLVTPITSLFRSFGNNQELNYQLLDAFITSDDLNCLLAWDKNTNELSDQGVRFKHPLIAKKLISLTNPNIQGFPIELIWPIIQNLHAGSEADIWLAENVAFQILRTQRRGRGEHIPYLELRLETYKKIPQQISDYNKAILHHWARALYHGATEIQSLKDAGVDPSTDPIMENLDNDILLQEAIAKIEKAISLPSQIGRGEHPAHLYTTLGTIYFEVYKRRANNQSNLVITESGWEKTFDCFRKALNQIPDSYPTLAAYSNRLIDRAVMIKAERHDEAISLALEALSHLSQAEDVANEPGELAEDEHSFLISQKKKAWDIIDPQKAKEMIDELISRRDENGYLILAWQDIADVDFNQNLLGQQITQVTNAIKTLSDALNLVKPPISWRIYHLLYKLYGAHPKFHFDFSKRLKILEALEKTDFKWHLRMRFEYATLCYQNNHFEEGQRRFRDLRSLLRQPDQPQKRFSDFLRSSPGDEPRITTMRVLRIDSEWRGYCSIQEMNQEVPFRPRQFDNPPKVGEYRRCQIRFETMGPLAVPDNFPVRGE